MRRIEPEAGRWYATAACEEGRVVAQLFGGDAIAGATAMLTTVIQSRVANEGWHPA